MWDGLCVRNTRQVKLLVDFGQGREEEDNKIVRILIRNPLFQLYETKQCYAVYLPLKEGRVHTKSAGLQWGWLVKICVFGLQRGIRVVQKVEQE